jgi:hypothetical protein
MSSEKMAERRFPPPWSVDHYAGRDDELILHFVGDASAIRC